MLFAIDWKFHEGARSDGATFFVSQSLEYVQQVDPGKCRLLGRFHNMANFTGLVICEADSAEDIYEWVFNWTEDMCTAKITPIMTDDEAREMVLGKKSSFCSTPGLDALKYVPAAGEAIFMCRWELFPNTLSRPMILLLP